MRMTCYKLLMFVIASILSISTYAVDRFETGWAPAALHMAASADQAITPATPEPEGLTSFQLPDISTATAWESSTFHHSAEHSGHSHLFRKGNGYYQDDRIASYWYGTEVTGNRRATSHLAS